MTDRREAVAKAIMRVFDLYAGATPEEVEKEWSEQQELSTAEFLDMADAAIAAMNDAEPTDAEIEAAADAMFRVHFSGVVEGSVIQGGMFREWAHAALIAARGAGQS